MRIMIVTPTALVMAEWDDGPPRRPRAVQRGRPRAESWDRVVAYLREHGPATASAVAEALGVSRVWALHLLRADERVEPAGRDGRRVLYGLRAAGSTSGEGVRS